MLPSDILCFYVNSHLKSFQLKESDRLNERFRTITCKVCNYLKKCKGGKTRTVYLSKVNRIAIFSTELENIQDLNSKLESFRLENVRLEARCSEFLGLLENEINRSAERSAVESSNARYDKILDDNPKLKDYINCLDKHLSQKSVKSYGATSVNNKARKLRSIENQAHKTLWFAETYGLIPEKIRCKTTLGEYVNLNLNQVQVNDYNLLCSEDKIRLKELVYILDRFCVSDEAYHELSKIGRAHV